ncbi:hypothetical protein [Glaesserella parasuis]|nr:hypothetical protein [Glaesserella parasuis]MDG6246331.1 hypothetical protein [Glaesserella parasuis]MDG6276865.1 hypothetical protein [Glaesserella parasuis]MDG6325362.1 hypothetical protein [Glaesserella parasuis]MDG6329202.1 hypothetical protein [Glaesserella parasuis]MDG6359569.1 hypothetical protein [Glaesserella parasuis]
MKDFNEYFMKLFKIDKKTLHKLFQNEIKFIENRSINEKSYWEGQIKRIKSLTREEAIEELLKEINISSKIDIIDGFVEAIKNDERLYL